MVSVVGQPAWWGFSRCFYGRVLFVCAYGPSTLINGVSSLPHLSLSRGPPVTRRSLVFRRCWD